MEVGSTREEASHVIVESDLVTSNIPGDRRDDSDTSGSMQRRNPTEVLEWSRPIELDSSACTNRTQKPAYCRVQQLHTPKLTGQVMSRAYPTLSLFQQSTISAAPSIYSLRLAPGAQPLMVCSVNWPLILFLQHERARHGFSRGVGCISNETISPTLWRPPQNDLVTSKGDPTPGDPHELTRRRLGVSILHPVSRALSSCVQ